MTPPNLDLESAAHEASRSQPTSNSAPSDPVGTFQCDEPVYHDTPIELVSTALPLIFFLFFLVGAIVLVYALAQRQAIPRQLAIGLAVTIGIILSLWGLAISLYYRGRIASRTLLGRPKKVGCPIRQEDRAVIIETVIEKPNQTRCEAKRIERIQMWAGGIFQGVSLPGVRSRSPSERKGTRQSVITSFLHNPDGSWPNQVQGPEQVATAPRNHRRQIVAAETRISVASSNGMTPKEGRLLGAAKHYSASHEPSSPERKAARIPHHKGASTAPKVHHDQQPLSGDLAQERDGLSDQHLPKTLGFGDASRANDILDPGEGPSKKTHQKVEKPADISQILDKPPKRQNIRQEHTRVMSVEIPLSQLPLPPQRTSSQAQMPRAHLKTRSSPAYVKRRKYREPHKPQRSLSTAIDCSSSSAYSGLSSRAQKPLALRPATALHERQNPRPRQDTSIGSSGGEALPSPQGSRSPPQSNTGPLEFLELRRSAYIPFGELLVGGIAGNELVHEEAGRKYQAYRVSEEDEEVPAEGTSYKPYRPSNEEERPAVDNGGYRVYNPDPGPGPIQRQQAYYTGEFVHEELSESWNEQSKGAALQVEHFKHVAHPVSAQVCTRTPYRGNEAPDSSSLAQPGLAHNETDPQDDSDEERHKSYEEGDEIAFTVVKQKRTVPPDLDSRNTLPSSFAPPTAPLTTLGSGSSRNGLKTHRNTLPKLRVDSKSQERSPDRQSPQARFVEKFQAVQREQDVAKAVWREERKRERKRKRGRSRTVASAGSWVTVANDAGDVRGARSSLDGSSFAANVVNGGEGYI